MPGPSSIRNSSIPPVPPSPALSATSSLPPNLPPHLRPSLVVTRKDQATSLETYETLLTASKAYTQALLALSSASTDFAVALQQCARLKGAHKVGPQLHAASGLEFLIASHGKILADSFWKDFSIPLLEGFDEHRRAVSDRQISHERIMLEKSRELKECEEKNLRGVRGRKSRLTKDRDLGSFRKALEELQRLVDGLDEERAGHYVEVLAAEEEEWDRVSTRVSHLLRLQLEINERLSSKPLSDPILEPMLSAVPDPFSAYSYANVASSATNGQFYPNGNSAGTSAAGAAGSGEIFSVLQHSGYLPGGVNGSSGVDADEESLTPAGLLSPRAPAKGLSRPAAPSSSGKSPITPTRSRAGSPGVGEGSQKAQSDVAPTGNASPALQSGKHLSSQSQKQSQPLGTGPAGEFSFAALGLTSASHPPASTGLGGGASSIGSPLFGSEDGDSDRGGENERSRDRADAEQDAAEILEEATPTKSAASRPASFLPWSGNSKSGGAANASRATATTNRVASTSSNASSNGGPTAGSRDGGGGGGGGGLGRRLKKALSMIEDEPSNASGSTISANANAGGEESAHQPPQGGFVAKDDGDEAGWADATVRDRSRD